MDTKELIIWAIGAILIAVGLPFFYVGRYLLASEEQKKQKARDIKGIGILWMTIGVLIYIVTLTLRFITKS